MSTALKIAATQAALERQFLRLELAELAQLINRPEGFSILEFWCPFCQRIDAERTLQGPGARLYGPEPWRDIVQPREATRWACSCCGIDGTRTLLLRLLIEDASVMEDFARRVVASGKGVMPK